MARLGLVINSDDDQTIQELEGVTEVQLPSGNTRYEFIVPGQDHRTDSTLCLLQAILSLEGEDTEYGNFDNDEELGWIDPGGGGNGRGYDYGLF